MNEAEHQVNQIAAVREIVDYVAEAIDDMLVDDEDGPGDDMSSSDDSLNTTDSSDDEDVVIDRRRLHRTINYIENTVHILDDLEFIGHVHRFRQTNYLVNNEPHPNAITHEKAFLLTLWYLANTETFREVSDRFNVTLSSSHRVLLQTLNFIISLQNEYVQWPNTHQEKQLISDQFRDIQGIDGIIGAIDGSHIKIVRPIENQRDYYNRKMYHSIVLQIIATSTQNIIDIYVGEPGSMHDSRVCRRSPIYEMAETDPDFFWTILSSW
ncbi:hypothetical protein HCN44_006004 [Aphidius gifuensis]|uniref:DDE Tnp4 domain-containing protein n=1 Tax=Aphidius gifuensis TaxID=684658 RepID=A0A834Y5D4_APHGI|nr:hypothetical protein HCN44_006004 [Aphidius gifuensis]